MKRVFYFVATNLAILVVLGIVLNLAEGFLAAQGVQLPMQGLLLFALVFGMGGSFLSLAISKWMAKRSTGARVIESPRTDSEAWLVETVRRQAQAVGIGMPEVAVFDSPAPNAFATGARRDNSLVAVSTGLLHTMDRSEVEAVLAHEVSHVANGDMITLTLIQGVVNTFVLLFSRVIGQAVDRIVFRSERDFGIGYFVSVMVVQLLLGFLASMIVFRFSRQREFRADAGSARLEGAPKMISALQSLQRSHTEPLPDQLAAFGIAGARGNALSRLFMTHPPIEERIEALRRFAR